ncbi:hypothetical protein AB0N16_11130 [Streptomyces sp. NPDC051105]|uniref:hypothetical protein n=1 Tax=Streptomyces sp. NPDC051105 TaxID=3154843 RepID=UPI0034337D7C
MNIGGRTGWAVTAAAVAAVLGITACGPTGTGPHGGKVRKGKSMAAAADGTALLGARCPVPGARCPASRPRGDAGGACVFVKPDGAQKFGHAGWGFRITGMDRGEYGAVENPSGKLYTPPGGDIGAWHVQVRRRCPARSSSGRGTVRLLADQRPSSTSNSPASRIALTAVR